MEAVSSVRSGFLGVLLAVVRLSVLLVQNWAHLYNFLLLKIILFNHWLSGLAQQATPPGLVACPLGRVLQAGLALWVPRLLWAGTLGCAQALYQAPQWLGAWECLGLSPATWTDLLLSCLHSLILLVLPLLLMIWRLCWKAHHCGLGWLPSKVGRWHGLGLSSGSVVRGPVARQCGHVSSWWPPAWPLAPFALLENRVVLEPLAQLERLYWRVESMTVLTSWHLAYLVTWPTCLACHLLQAAFEHTAQLVQTQEAEPQEASRPLSQFPEAGPVLPEHGTPGE